jgi:hypothetical protein
VESLSESVCYKVSGLHPLPLLFFECSNVLERSLSTVFLLSVYSLKKADFLVSPNMCAC